MSDSELLLRLLKENYELKDELAKEKVSSDYWFKRYSELEAQYHLQTNTTESNDDISLPAKVEKELPLTPEGLKNKCNVVTI